MKRLPLNQTKYWSSMLDDGFGPYDKDRCCFCGRGIEANAAQLQVSRTDDGEWFVCDPADGQQPDEVTHGRFVLPIGSDCLRRHPEFKFAIVEK